MLWAVAENGSFRKTGLGIEKTEVFSCLAGNFLLQRAEKASGCLPGIIMMRVRDTDSWDWKLRRGRRTGLPGRADGIRGRRIALGTEKKPGCGRMVRTAWK